ncbi:M9 family metallopeptidase [Massilia sp. CCM 8734]|uniref:M9 family metallopeptidase n=1 Tax=Massilia sp. CCM 8734 TaxID=2609283 RepID=UPI001423FDE0|nr:M9 family metallopeptidase [Massilia sp. CCM 8734]NHZ96329.1 collagenase [Massilia sp. CCM 8734]
MFTQHKIILLTGLVSACFSSVSYAKQADTGHTHERLKQAPMPHARQSLPPTVEQQRFNVAPTTKPRVDLMPKQPETGRMSLMAATPECKNMDTLTSYNGAALADYLVAMPDFECTYPLFSLTAAQAVKAYSSANMNAVAARFAQEASAYNASNRALVNLALYLRAGYYLGGSGTIATPSAAYTASLRAPIRNLVEGTVLYKTNPLAGSTAAEVIKLITNTHDEAYFLPSMKKLVVRFTNSPSTPNAVDAIKQSDAAGGLTSALTVLFYAHSRPDALPLLQSDTSYPVALNNFVVKNKSALLGTSTAYMLNDAANEAFRFMQHAAQKATVKPMVQATLASSSMTGADSALWLAAASAVKYYDNANCAVYGTCGYEQKLADTVLKVSHTCSPTLRIRAQEMTLAQLQSSCAILQKEEGYFHDMLLTKRVPVANDKNATLELVVFDDYANYGKYASVIYDIDTNNGGMYLEGNPESATNQARFIAHEASWLRPAFSVWNLEHEYVHYLDGRFNMFGDFGAAVSKPSVWWIEGIGEYLSLRNNNQPSIDKARTSTYKLSEIFGNTYSMGDYTDRAYRWGYMATRFMVEKHRSDVDAVLGKFRVGDYDGYQNYMGYIGTRYDAEFAAWVKTATTAGEPPLPQVNLPACNQGSYLGKNCSITGFTSSSESYAHILLPAGAKNLRLFTSGGSGNADMYVSRGRYPSTTWYDSASVTSGNSESVNIAAPVSGQWYYIMLKAKPSFSGVTISATYD